MEPRVHKYMHRERASEHLKQTNVRSNSLPWIGDQDNNEQTLQDPTEGTREKRPSTMEEYRQLLNNWRTCSTKSKPPLHTGVTKKRKKQQPQKINK